MKKIILVLLLNSFLGCAERVPHNDSVYAVLNGKPILENQLKDVSHDLILLRRREYDIKHEALEKYVEETLWQNESLRLGMTVNELQAKIVDSVVVSPKEIDQFLNEHPQSPLDNAARRRAVPFIIKRVKGNEALRTFILRLKSKAAYEAKIEMPAEELFKVGTGSYPALGSPKPKVSIIEFGDYQCPASAKGNMIVRDILTKYKEGVGIYFRNLPLGLHPRALPAAVAAGCAAEQNKYWEYSDLLFKNNSHLDDESLVKYADQTELKRDSFEKCLHSSASRNRIEEDLKTAQQFGIHSTPTFLINGRIILGAREMEDYVLVINDELKKAKGL